MTIHWNGVPAVPLHFQKKKFLPAISIIYYSWGFFLETFFEDGHKLMHIMEYIIGENNFLKILYKGTLTNINKYKDKRESGQENGEYKCCHYVCEMRILWWGYRGLTGFERIQ